MRTLLLAPLAGLALAAAAVPPVPADNALTAARVELGRRLFYDADLSVNGTLSCASCHEQRHGFADSVAARPGATGEPGRRNAPGLANVAWFDRLTHADPALTTLERQAAVPLLGDHPVEMGMAGREAELAGRLERDPCYRRMFAKAFPEQQGRIGFDTVAKALAGFQRKLVSFGSAYDRGRLAGDAAAGQAVFARDCAGCHTGPLFTDLAYHRLGAPDPAAADPGLAEKTGSEDDRGKFRTPSLRNAAFSAPYWHDGSVATLGGAIDRHAIPLAAAERARLIAFLQGLSDDRFVSRKDLAMPTRACGRLL